MANVKMTTWIDLACKLGVVEDTASGRRAYESWLRRDSAAAQQPVCAALDVRNANAQRGSGPSRSGQRSSARRSRVASGAVDSYPDSWRTRSVMRPAGVRASGESHTPKSTARGRVVHAAGSTATLLAATKRAGLLVQSASQGSTVGSGYHDAHNDVAAAGTNARRLEAMRRAELDRMSREVWHRH